MDETGIIRPNGALDEFVIMPDHLHGIIWLTDETDDDHVTDVGARRAVRLQRPASDTTADSENHVMTPCPRTARRAPTDITPDMAITPDAPTARRARADIPWRVATRHEQFGKPTAGTIPTMIRAFKSAVTGRVNETQNTPDERVWQRNYYEHVIRDAKALYLIRKYIRDNPLQ